MCPEAFTKCAWSHVSRHNYWADRAYPYCLINFCSTELSLHLPDWPQPRRGTFSMKHARLYTPQALVSNLDVGTPEGGPFSLRQVHVPEFCPQLRYPIIGGILNRHTFTAAKMSNTEESLKTVVTTTTTSQFQVKVKGSSP